MTFFTVLKLPRLRLTQTLASFIAISAVLVTGLITIPVLEEADAKSFNLGK
jgi:hypothetical protein